MNIGEISLSKENGIAIPVPLTIEMFHKDVDSGRGICTLMNVSWM
jgi:hypothetical protein